MLEGLEPDIRRGYGVVSVFGERWEILELHWFKTEKTCVSSGWNITRRPVLKLEGKSLQSVRYTQKYAWKISQLQGTWWYQIYPNKIKTWEKNTVICVYYVQKTVFGKKSAFLFPISWRRETIMLPHVRFGCRSITNFVALLSLLAQKTDRLKPLYVYDDTETLLSRRHCKIDDTGTSLSAKYSKWGFKDHFEAWKDARESLNSWRNVFAYLTYDPKVMVHFFGWTWEAKTSSGWYLSKINVV